MKMTQQVSNEIAPQQLWLHSHDKSNYFITWSLFTDLVFFSIGSLTIGILNFNAPLVPSYHKEIWEHKNANTYCIQKTIFKFGRLKSLLNQYSHEKCKTSTEILMNVVCNLSPHKRSSKFSSYEIELRNRVTQIDVTLRVTNPKIFIEVLPSSY